MKNQKGFIQISALVIIIAGILILGVGGFFLVNKNSQERKDIDLRDVFTQGPIRQGEISALECRTKILNALSGTCSSSGLKDIKNILDPKVLPMGGISESECRDLTNRISKEYCEEGDSDPFETEPPVVEPPIENEPPEITANCPKGGITIKSGDDISSIINRASKNDTFCISGKHRAEDTIKVKNGQTLLGITSDAAISGAKKLTGWKKEEPGVWSYSGNLATRKNVSDTFGGSDSESCFEVTIFQDDVFYLSPGGSADDDTRMMRVLSLNQLKGLTSLPEGQAETGGEFGRFFFDYDNDKIYIDQDPIGATVDLAYLGTLIQGEQDHVTLENLLLEKARDFIVDSVVGKDSVKGKSWVISNVTIRFAHNTGLRLGGGISSSDPEIVRDSVITNNGQFGMGGGGVWYEIDNVEISWNNIANYRRFNNGECRGYWGAGSAKFVLVNGGDVNTPSMYINNLNSHHNLGDGFWSDIINQYVLIENSEFHENERSGYFMEISCDIEIRNNEFWGNGIFIKNDMLGTGMSLTNANSAYIHDNTFTDNKDFELALSYSANGHENHLKPCFNVTNHYDGTNSLKDNLFENNVIKMCSSVTGAIDRTNLTSRNNLFIGNTYYVPDVNGKWWNAGTGKDLNWDQWQKEGQDKTGSVKSYQCK